MKIGEKAIEEIKTQVEGLTRAWIVNINDAFNKFGKEKFPIIFKAVLDTGKYGGINIKTEIKFRPEPDISDTAVGNVDENQMTIFEKPRPLKVIRPSPTVGLFPHWGHRSVKNTGGEHV